MSKTPLSIGFFYTLFAVFSILINICSQMASIWFYKGPFSVEISILVGTITGLPIRYFLEKYYIFSFKSRDMAHDSKVFVTYSLMSINTTGIFWLTEYAFHLLYSTEVMRYIGGVIGLAIGFYAKYHLDKKYVFVKGDKRVF